MTWSRKCAPQSRTRHDGMALVIVLGALVLFTVLIVAFFSRALLNRQISFTSTNLVRTDQIARLGLDHVVGELRTELRTNSVVSQVGGRTFFLPDPDHFAGWIPTRDPNFSTEPNLVRISSASPPGGSHAATALGGSSAEKSRNNRWISPRLWEKSGLRLGSATGTNVPDWILVTKDPSVTPTLTTAGDSASGGFVVGRYAYSIYDIGGLLDANVAGFPSVVVGSPEAGAKVGVAYADLTAIPGLPDRALADWRHPISEFPTVQAYDDHVTEDALSAGFLQTSLRSNTFVSRGDLIAFAERNDITNALPYLANSLVSRNSPSIPAGSDPNLNPDFALLVSPITEQPISRFPLSRFALLDQDPSALSGEDLADINKYFGLEPLSGSSNTYRAWQYRSPTIGTPAAAIAAGRDPDLFELIKAAIANGSLGVNEAKSTNTTNTIRQLGGGSAYLPETNIHHQVARIVANMIDQYDADNYPTTIVMGSNAVANTVYGIENLPYFSELLLKVLYPAPFATAATPGTLPGHFRMYFELWNPHQGTPPANSPNNIRIVVNPEARFEFTYLRHAGGTGTGLGSVWSVPGYKEFPSTYLPTGAGVPIGNPNAYTNARVVTQPIDMTSEFPVDVPPPIGTNYISFRHNRAVYSLQYQDDGGNWRTYSTFAGHDNDGGNTGIQNTGNFTYLSYTDASVDADGVPNLFNLGIPKSDPRTFRFRTGTSGPSSTKNSPMLAGGVDQELREHYPEHFPGFGLEAPSKFNNPGWLFKNDGTGTGFGKIAVEDYDGVARVADGYLGSETTTNPMAVEAARPIILNRPFRSVGELGHVFRDSPWKSLNFFSQDSGDAGLLDLFCMEETDVIAGRTSLNTPHPEVLQALIQGAFRNETGVAIDETAAAELAQEIVTRTAVGQSSSAPFSNLKELATGLPSYSSTQVGGAYPALKTQREALIRALAGAGDTRTWNLLIDLVAQVGRYPANPSSFDEFIVEGVRHYWLQIAIDRVTGEILRTHLEMVNE